MRNENGGDAPVTRHMRNRSQHGNRAGEATEEAKELSSKHQSSDGPKRTKASQNPGHKSRLVS